MRIFYSVPWLLLLVSTAQSLGQTPATTAKLDDEQFKKLHAMLQASPDEAWRTIPWRIELLDAQQLAAEEHKPIFIWAMDGHPLGCT